MSPFSEGSFPEDQPEEVGKPIEETSPKGKKGKSDKKIEKLEENIEEALPLSIEDWQEEKVKAEDIYFEKRSKWAKIVEKELGITDYLLEDEEEVEEQINELLWSKTHNNNGSMVDADRLPQKDKDQIEIIRELIKKSEEIKEERDKALEEVNREILNHNKKEIGEI